MSKSDGRENDSMRYGEFVQREARRQEAYRKQDALKDALTEANQHVAKGDHYTAGRILRDVILPTIQRLDNAHPWSEYHRQLHHDDTYDWNWPPFHEFIEHSDRILERIGIDQSSGGSTSFLGRGTAAEASRARQTVEKALASAESISTFHDITDAGLSNKATVEGFSLKLGEHLQDYEMNLGDPVKAVSTQAGALKTLFVGGTGMGKSTGAEREFEDFYQRNFKEGRDYKCIDVAGMRDGETWFYDIPQRQKPLRRIREEQSLPADFTESDDLGEAEIQILVPLTPDLESTELPYDTERERFTVQPFTVPASGLRKTLLVRFISSRLSDGQEETIRSAYEAVDRNYSDWALKDLGDEIRTRDELPPKNKATAINVLQSLQDQGFIRTGEHDATLDWRDIFTDTDRVTVFSQALLSDKIAKYTCFAYLIDAISTKRETMYGIPQVALLMRELWKISPHKRRQSAFPEVAALQEAIATMLSEIFRENRHGGIHVIADTQEPSDLHIAVREMFNRYVVFSATKDSIQDMFEWTQNERYKAFVSTMTQKAGEAGIVGQVEPAIENRHIEFLSPVRYVPPSHHHRISPGDDIGMKPDLNGWTARCKYLDHEELRRPVDVEVADFDGSVPEDMELDAVEQAEQSSNPYDAPVAAFAHQCLIEADRDEWIHKDELYAAFNEYLQRHDKDTWDFSQRSKQTTFGERVRNAFEDVKSKRRSGKPALCGVAWTNFGRDVYEQTLHEEPRAADFDQ